MTDRLREVTCRNERKNYSVKTGELIGRTRRLSAVFERGIPGWAIPLALELFPLAPSMKPDGMPLERWLCWYDSRYDQRMRGWTDEERLLIEERLAARPGIRVVEPVKLAAPWPAYDKLVVHGQRKIEHVVAKIVETVQELEIDPGLVIAYEKQELNRPEVVAAVAAIGAPEPDEEELVAA
jgi:hypothetical protein